jgi:hypothetical protein
MKKTIISFALLLFAFSAFAQKDSAAIPKKDTVPVLKKDTVRIPVLIIQHTDTVPVTLVYAGSLHCVMYANGFYTLSGLKLQDGSWAAKPTEAIFDEKWHPFKGKLLSQPTPR